MSLPVVKVFEGGEVQAVVKRDAKWDEYVVEFWIREKVQGRFAHRPQADYRTSDKQDALDTAKAAANSRDLQR
jgi:hypothetical protein